MMIYIILGFILSYLLGSIPTSVWVGKAFYGIDVREHGSKNAGATNTLRVLGKKPGFFVLFADLLKGWMATNIAWLLVNLQAVSDDRLIIFQIALGMTAVLGHVYPIYVNFKGGKGVATLFGMIIAIHFKVALLCVLVFIIVLTISKYVSLSSMTAALFFPLLLLTPWFKTDEPILIWFGFFLFLLLVYTHRKNIERLIKGEENRFSLKKKQQ